MTFVCQYMVSVSPSFGASGSLCFKLMAFPMYLDVYFCCKKLLVKAR